MFGKGRFVTLNPGGRPPGNVYKGLIAWLLNRFGILRFVRLVEVELFAPSFSSLPSIS